MDPDTQRLIERTRQRREMLNQRIAGMPEAAPRKRRTPVLDNEETESVLAEKQNNQDDSPKRQCVREVEQEVKPDTPAIRGVHSRIQDLPSTLTRGNEENRSDATPTPKPRKSVSSPPMERRAPPASQQSPVKQATDSSSVTSTRKGRLAALAQNINNWEDDLSHPVIHKEEEKKPRWQPPPKMDNPPACMPKATHSGKGPAPAAPAGRLTAAVTHSIPPSSPKKTHAPPTPRNNVPASPSTNLARNSPLRSSKVEWNRSPKPFVSPYADKNPVLSKSAPEVNQVASSVSSANPTKAASDTSVSSLCQETPRSVVSPNKSTAALCTAPADLPVNAPGLNETPPSDTELNKTVDEPTTKPVSQRFAAWAQRTETPKAKPVEPSRQPMSAKLASFEQKISENTPRTGMARSVHVPKTQKQVCTPALSASTPAASSTSVARPKNCDPSELPVSQRMSQMQEKLTPRMRPKQDEPTAYSVGARMSAWENMTSSNQVSNIKKVNPGEATPVTTKATASVPKPTIAATPAQSTAPPENPPPPPAIKAAVSSKKSFRDCIAERASQVLAKKGVPASSPSKTNPAPGTTPGRATVASPSKTVHSPSKVSAGTKTVQQILAEKTKDSDTNCSAKAAQSRAERMAELEVIQNRWKNGILKDDKSGSSSDEAGKPSDIVRPKSPAPPTAQPKTPISSKREDARNKARADFNSRLAQTGLVDNASPARSVSSSGAAPASQTLPASAKSTPQGQTTNSIYNLIRKREDTVQQPNEDNKKVKFNDSFDDSDDDPEQKIPRSAARRAAVQAAQRREEEEQEGERFKKPSVPKTKEDSEDPASNSDLGDEDFASSCRLPMDLDDDDISLKDFASEAVRRESILPAKGQNTTSQSSLDSYDDDSHQAFDSEGSLDHPSSSKHGGYRPDDESMDDDEDISDRNAVDDLLDEAMDSTSDDYDPDMDPKNVVMRRTGRAQGSSYDPDMDPNNVVMRRKTEQPPSRNPRGVESTDDDDDDARPYSLQAYRKSANVHQHLMEPVVRKSRYANLEVKEEDIAMPSVERPRRDDKRAVQERIKELQELVQQEQNVIMQTSNALNKCCMGNSYFAGSAEQVECNRVLLIACQKRQCYMTEIQRLKDTGCLSQDGPGPHGSLTINDIRLPLKKEFVTKIGTSQDTTTHYFILLIRNGCQLICTQMLSTHDSMMRGSLDFPNLIKINGITGNFRLTLDIYSMSISREMLTKDKKKKTPKKKAHGFPLESPGGPMAVRTTSFSHVTSVELTMKNIDKTSFHLDRLPHLSPLYGQIFMRLKCLMEVNVEERGFLTMFEDVSGFGAWHRRWCVLSGNKLCVWKYPDDESRKDPMAFIDLKRCITEKVGLVPRDICARPNTFEMVTVRQPLKGEHDTLITKTYNSTTMVRHQMSADSKEERIVWCNKINRTLANLRTWNADALKPMRATESSSYR